MLLVKVAKLYVCDSSTQDCEVIISRALTVAKDFIRHMNNTMPEMEVNGALQTFGRGIEVPMRQTETVYGRTVYSRYGLEQSLNSINFPAEGNSPAGLPLEKSVILSGLFKVRML